MSLTKLEKLYQKLALQVRNVEDVTEIRKTRKQIKKMQHTLKNARYTLQIKDNTDAKKSQR